MSRARIRELARLTLAAVLVAGSVVAAVRFALDSGDAAAEPIDPSLPQRVVVGAPPGAAPMFRVDGARSGRTREALPTVPRVLWRARIPGGLEHPIAVDARGHAVFVGAAGQITELSASGKVAWSFKTGGASALVGPVIASDGTRFVITSAGELLAIGQDGSERHRRALPLADLRGLLQPLASADGGVVLAAAGHLLRIDGTGTVLSRAGYKGNAVTLLERGARLLVVLDNGDVLEWRPPAEPSKLASFSGRVEDGATFTESGYLTAVVDHLRVMDLNLKTGTRHTRFESTEPLQGPPTALRAGETRVASQVGLLLGHDRTGAETLRVALEPSAAGSDGGSFGFGMSPPLITDDTGRVGFVRPGLDAGVVLPGGEIKTASGAACGDPIALSPAGKERMVLGCRSGLVFMIGK